MTEESMNTGTHGPRPVSGVTLSVADRELIDRYLAGRLDDDACAQVEARIVADAAFRGEFELTEQLREGLHELEVRGELGSLDRDPRRFWQRPTYALAASVAAGLLGIAALALYGQLQDTRAALVELKNAGALRSTATGRTRVVTLARTRSSCRGGPRAQGVAAGGSARAAPGSGAQYRPSATGRRWSGSRGMAVP